MVFLLNIVAFSVIGVSLPNLQANPAELIFASAGHVDAAAVFVDECFTHWALLSHQFVQPLVFLLVHHVIPHSQVRTVQGEVVVLATKTTYFTPTLASQNTVQSQIYQNGFIAAFLRA